jgi:enoyl-CoA hydratase
MVSMSRLAEFAIVTLDRVKVLNALNQETLRQLDSILTQIEGSDARCVIFRGAGEKAFCAGADIAELVDRDLNAAYEGTILGQKVFSRIETLRQPSVALVEGVALGGGCELALACTFRLATPKARFGLPEIKLGLVPGFGGTQRLARLIGLSRSLEIQMSGRFVGPDEALQMGLINRILDGEESALDQALTFGHQFTGWSMVALRLIREATRRGLDMSLSDGLELEAQLSTLSFQSNDGREGLAAFLQKRQPRVSDS